MAPDGYETEVGDAGQAFGRREKRVAIARTILKGPPICCSTRPHPRSTAQPRRIQDALERVSRGRTTAGHRASAFHHCWRR